MPVLALTWLASPFLSGALIAACPAGRRFAARFWLPLLMLGWIGVAMVVAGALVLERPLGTLVLLAGGPLAGLSFWVRRDHGGGDEGDDEAPEPPPPGDDWERIVSDFRAYVDAHAGGGAHARPRGRSVRRPAPARSPSAAPRLCPRRS